jgi:dihydroxyacetone kinase-like protein
MSNTAATLDYARLTAMLKCAATQIRNNHETLSKLDSCGGDGDHGTTMVRAMNNMEGAIAKAKPPDMKALLQAIGWAIMGTDGGATGPLFGTFFSAMSPVAGTNALDAAGVAKLFEAGLAGLQKTSKAKVGDKTMMDALVPAVGALRKAADGGATVVAALEAAAGAAEQGAQETAKLQARFGRAKNIGEKSIGTPDPGATSAALMFRGFLEGVKTNA